MLTLNLEDNKLESVEGKNLKRKQKLVKHRRKNWKKTDISEVEQGIEELRKEELTGGVRAEKKDEDLFFVSKKKLKIDENDELTEQLPKKKVKQTLEEKMQNLACYRALKPDPHSAPAHNLRTLAKAIEGSKRQQFLNEKMAKKYSARLDAKKRLRIKNFVEENAEEVKKNGRKDRNYVLTESNFNTDIWKPVKPSTDNAVLEKEQYLKHTKKVIPKKPNNPMKTKSVVSKVQLPHPGMSYNPDYDDHQDLLLQAHLVELKKLQDEQKLMRRLKDNLSKMSWQEIENIWVEEMSCNNLFEEDEKEDLDQKAKEEENELVEVALKDKKTAKKKRKQMLEKIKQKQKESEKKVRIQQNEIYRLKSIKKEVEKKVNTEKEKAIKKEIEEKHKELFGTKRLGSLKYEEPELAVKLSDEISGNLRNLKPEGNILTDRYKSLQKRNLIEPRQKAKRYHKFWKKRFEKKNAYEVTHGL